MCLHYILFISHHPILYYLISSLIWPHTLWFRLTSQFLISLEDTLSHLCSLHITSLYFTSPCLSPFYFFASHFTSPRPSNLISPNLISFRKDVLESSDGINNTWSNVSSMSTWNSSTIWWARTRLQFDCSPWRSGRGWQYPGNVRYCIRKCGKGNLEQAHYLWCKMTGLSFEDCFEIWPSKNITWKSCAKSYCHAKPQQGSKDQAATEQKSWDQVIAQRVN